MQFDFVPESERVQWLPQPQRKWLKVDSVKIGVLGNEATVVFEAQGLRQAAIVPVHATDENAVTVMVYVLGSLKGALVLALPTGSMGTSTWQLPRSLEDERLLEVAV